MFFKKQEKQNTNRMPRIAKMTTPELLNWYNSILVMNGVAFDEWRYKDGSEQEVTSSIRVLNEIWEELMSRQESLSNN